MHTDRMNPGDAFRNELADRGFIRLFGEEEWSGELFKLHMGARPSTLNLTIGPDTQVLRCRKEIS